MGETRPGTPKPAPPSIRTVKLSGGRFGIAVETDFSPLSYLLREVIARNVLHAKVGWYEDKSQPYP